MACEGQVATAQNERDLSLFQRDPSLKGVRHSLASLLLTHSVDLCPEPSIRMVWVCTAATLPAWPPQRTLRDRGLKTVFSCFSGVQKSHPLSPL